VLNLNQAALTPKQLNLNKLGDAGGFKFSDCPTQRKTDSSGCFGINTLKACSKKVNVFIFSILFSFLFMFSLCSQETFKAVVLGCHGGPKENNLSGYLIAPSGSNDFIALDAGTLLEGIFLAAKNNCFSGIKTDPNSDLSLELEVFRNHIKAYLISHAHLDHIAGLVINSTADIKKPIYGIDSTIDLIRDNLFNWKIWPNFGSEGQKPLINQYQYQRMKIEKQVSIPNSSMKAEPFILSHPNGYLSTAFLIESSDSYIVYFGDTSPDALESQKHIEKVWKKIAQLIVQKKLRAIFIECSYSDKRPDSKLFGHLNPKYLLDELGRLALIVDPKSPQTALKDLKVVVTHIKDTLLKGDSAQQIIERELEKGNNLNIQFIFPKQGQMLEL
ncbi:MAG: 3',5'-cyclic-nucleotide phosphodiesterase, partial [Verrucomicrobia bacterium]|nr:3',5'-cyclic-nucleotide phosphodiesterase [Verrucomicrobiota bacterium]